MDIPCPHCGQLNESQREFCWACFKLLKPEKTPPPGPAGALDVPAPPPEQVPPGPFNVTRTTKTSINVNGQNYARLEDVPERFRPLIEDSLRRAGLGEKSRIVVNGVEYHRLEDVPEQFRSKLQEGLAKAKLTGPAPAPPGTSTFRIGPVTVRSRGMYISEPLEPPPDAPMEPPRGFKLDDDGVQRTVSWRWLSWASFGGIYFAAVFGVPFAFVLYIYRHSPPDSWPPHLALKMLGLLGAAPAAFLYAWLAYLVNRTTLRVDPERVSIRFGPLPWLGGKDIPRSEIAQIFGERLTSNPTFNSDGTAFRPRVMYAVDLVLKNGKTVKLTKGLLAPEHAQFIEQQLRKLA